MTVVESRSRLRRKTRVGRALSPANGTAQPIGPMSTEEPPPWPPHPATTLAAIMKRSEAFGRCMTPPAARKPRLCLKSLPAAPEPVGLRGGVLAKSLVRRTQSTPPRDFAPLPALAATASGSRRALFRQSLANARAVARAIQGPGGEAAAPRARASVDRMPGAGDLSARGIASTNGVRSGGPAAKRNRVGAP